MNEVNALWISPWRELLKNLASSFVHKAAARRRLAENRRPRRRPQLHWLLRAQASEYPSYG